MLVGFMAWEIEDLDLLGQIEWLRDHDFAAVGFHANPLLAPRSGLDPTDLSPEDRLRLELLMADFRSCEIHAPFGSYDINLVSPNPWIRLGSCEALRPCFELGGALGARVVTIHTGATRAAVPPTQQLEHLRPVLWELQDLAAEYDVAAAIETADAFMSVEAFDLLAETELPHVGVTLDVGHVAQAGVMEVAAFIERYADLIFNVHLHDYNGSRDHITLGTGHLSLPPILAALRQIDYDGLLMLELAPDCGVEGFLGSRDTLVNWLDRSRPI